MRLARASLAGAVKLAVNNKILPSIPLAEVERPKPERSIPKHWTPEQARAFLQSQDGDRLYPLWAFLLGSGLRIGELIRLRWNNVDLDRRLRLADVLTYRDRMDTRAEDALAAMVSEAEDLGLYES